MANMSNSVNVVVEAVQEYQVQEITYDGQEIYVQPLSMSENLTKLAHKIDFSKTDSGDENESATTDEDPSNQKSLPAFQPSLWPWDSVRNSLRAALTEISVLADNLNIVQQKKYMVLDAVSQEPPEPKPVAVLLAKKKVLNEVATIILRGAERLRISQTVEPAGPNRPRNVPDFHLELLYMRQNWRLKRVGNAILGDLSYRSAGSQFWQSGVFEVTKNELALNPTSPPPPTPGGGPPRLSSLKVTLPSELEGISLIQVTIQKDTETIASGEMTMPQLAVNFIDAHWQAKLEAAQNVLFCKELFSQLAREAIQLQPPIPNLVVGNQITASLFPGVQLCIGLCHSTTQDSSKVKQSNESLTAGGIAAGGSSSGGGRGIKVENKPVLEHSLHQLLREVHHRATHHAMPHPTTAPFGFSKKRRLAGPEAHDRTTLAESSHSETLLEQIIRQTQHVVTRLRTAYIIDSFAAEIKDPLLIVHWTCFNSPTLTSVKINIVTMGYEAIFRTPLSIHIAEKSLKAISREGTVMNLSYEPQELRHYLMYQVAQHQINAAQSLAKLMGWKVRSTCNSVGVGVVEPIASASSLLISSPTGDRSIAVLSGAHSGIQVKVSLSSAQQDFYPSSLVRDRKWQNVGGGFRELVWEKMEGRTFLSKMEHLMASLTSLN